MRILFDINVLVAGFTATGSCHEIIQDSIYSYDIYYTDFLLNEFRTVLAKKFKFNDSLIRNFSKWIEKFFIKGETAEEIENVCRDKDDNYVLADASCNNIDIIITGDKDLLDIKTYKDIRIVVPNEYWNL